MVHPKGKYSPDTGEIRKLLPLHLVQAPISLSKSMEAATAQSSWACWNIPAYHAPHPEKPIVCRTVRRNCAPKMKKKAMKLKELSDLWRKRRGQGGTGTLHCSTPMSDPTTTSKPSTVVTAVGSFHGFVLRGFSPFPGSESTQLHDSAAQIVPITCLLQLLSPRNCTYDDTQGEAEGHKSPTQSESFSDQTSAQPDTCPAPPLARRHAGA